MWPTTRCKHTIHKHPVNHTVFIKPVFELMCSFLKHRLSLSSKCHLKHIILQIFIFHSSNESLSLINQFTPCFLVSNVSLIKSILLAECFSEQLGQRLFSHDGVLAAATRGGRRRAHDLQTELVSVRCFLWVTYKPTNMPSNHSQMNSSQQWQKQNPEWQPCKWKEFIEFTTEIQHLSNK